jgi:transposase-like protein
MKNKRSNKSYKPQIYSDDFKWKVVQEVLGGEITQAEAKRKYNIKSNSAILYWTRQLSGIENYRDSRVVYLPEHDMSEKKKKDTSKDDRIRELEEALEREQNRSLVYEMMIKVAEEDFGLPIRKKDGAKQLKELKKLRDVK